ncbi:MAG: hypothetical protein JST00_05875 [Deltaproteobacteria bacterium]|nr:hypothetical protein [Deltaproteobacteria bacterium]
MSAAGPARADSTAAETAAARTLGQDGVMLADQGKCAQAIEKLERAEKLRHAPTTAVRLGECEINVGKVIAGTERLQRLLREGLPNNPPKSFVTAMDRAQRVLDAGLPKIASLRVTLRAPKDAKPTVTVDDEPMKEALIGTDSPVDPGPHVVTAKAVGFLNATEKVDLKDGETRGITLTLQPDPSYKPEPPPKPAPSTTTTAPPPVAADTGSSSSASVLPWVAFGIGAVGLGVGAVTGIIVAGKKSDLDSGCLADGRCPPGQRSTLDSANSMATVSTIGFVVGGVGIAAGVVLLVTGTGRGSSTTGSPKAPGVKPIVGLGYAGVGGSF